MFLKEKQTLNNTMIYETSQNSLIHKWSYLKNKSMNLILVSN